MKVVDFEARDGEEMSAEYQMAVAMRILWHLVEKAGGSITLKQSDMTSIEGAFAVLIDDGNITVSVERDLLQSLRFTQ